MFSDADVEDNLESDTSRLHHGITDSEVSFLENGRNSPMLNSMETSATITSTTVTSTTITSSESSEHVCVNSLSEAFHETSRESVTQQQDKPPDLNSGMDDLTLATGELRLTERDKTEDSKPKENGYVDPTDCDTSKLADQSQQHVMNSEYQISSLPNQATDLNNVQNVSAYSANLPSSATNPADISLERQHSNRSTSPDCESVGLVSKASSLRHVNSVSSEIVKSENCCDTKNSGLKSDNDHVLDSVTSQAEAPACNVPSGRRLGAKQQKSRRELKQQGQYKSLSTLCPRYHPSAKECSLMSCLHQFTAPELLTGSNKFGCKTCTRLQKNRHAANKGETDYLQM